MIRVLKKEAPKQIITFVKIREEAAVFSFRIVQC